MSTNFLFFFFNDTATTEIYTLSLHDALPILKEKKIKSSIKGYLGFPAAICVSVNDEITHGIPDNRPFKQGDLVSFDVACHSKDKKGIAYHADAAMTVLLDDKEENDDNEKKKLISVAKNALQK